jgi:hypothetical protein
LNYLRVWIEKRIIYKFEIIKILMKKRNNMTKILIVFFIFLVLSIIAVSSAETETLEKNKGVLYNLLNIFSFKWIFQQELPLIPVVKPPVCLINCDCKISNYAEYEDSCFDIKDDNGKAIKQGILRKKTSYKKVINQFTGKCSWIQEPVVSEQQILCNVCQTCGNYPLLGGKILEVPDDAHFPYFFGPENVLNCPIKNFYVQNSLVLNIENVEWSKHEYEIKAVPENGDYLKISHEYPLGNIEPLERKSFKITVEVKKPFCGTKYGRISVKFAGAYYVYDVAVYMKKNCKCGENPAKPQLECVNYAIGSSLPLDYNGLRKAVSVTNGIPKVCRWGKILNIFEAIETESDFTVAAKKTFSILKDIGESEKRKVIRSVSECYFQLSEEDKNLVGIITVDNDEDFDEQFPEKKQAGIEFSSRKILYIKYSFYNSPDLCKSVKEAIDKVKKNQIQPPME